MTLYISGELATAEPSFGLEFVSTVVARAAIALGWLPNLGPATNADALSGANGVNLENAMNNAGQDIR